MKKLCIGIIFGGMSSEYEISLQSAKNISCVIDRDRFKVVMIRIGKDGMWHRESSIFDRTILSTYYKDIFLDIFRYINHGYLKDIFLRSLRNIIGISNNSCNILSRIDIVFPIIHGRFGEDGALQGLLKMKKIPFIGTDVLGSALSMDKDISKRLLRSAGLMVAPFVTLRNCDDLLDMSFEYCVDVLGLPLFVKPANHGSSIGISKIFDSVSFYQAIDFAFSLDQKVLIESVIVGRELECAVLGNKNPKVSVCGEVILDNDFYTYQKKYFCSSVKFVIPAQLSDGINDEIRDVVLRAFYVLQCSGMARVDIFLTSDNHVVVNEVNTLPGFTSTSMYPKLWEASGLNCRDLISILIELALERYDDEKRLYM